MTIVVTVKINDGIVLASDSATTFSDASGLTVKIYNNANKIFNLCKGMPIGALTYGNGSIGSASIATISKDLRRRFAGDDPAHADWQLNSETYTIQQVAERVRAFFFDELYAAAYPTPSPDYYLGYKVCGYNSGAALPEIWGLEIRGADCADPQLLMSQEAAGPNWDGEYEAMDRLILGVGTRFRDALINGGVDPGQAHDIQMAMIQNLSVPVILPAMPIQDAIDLATFMVETTIKFVRFNMRSETVGGPVEVAAITKHEGFKWVKRKHFFSEDLNP